MLATSSVAQSIEAWTAAGGVEARRNMLLLGCFTRSHHGVDDISDNAGLARTLGPRDKNWGRDMLLGCSRAAAAGEQGRQFANLGLSSWIPKIQWFAACCHAANMPEQPRGVLWRTDPTRAFPVHLRRPSRPACAVASFWGVVVSLRQLASCRVQCPNFRADCGSAACCVSAVPGARVPPQ